MFTSIFFAQKLEEQVISNFRPVESENPVSMCMAVLNRRPKCIGTEHVIAVNGADEFNRLMTAVEIQGT